MKILKQYGGFIALFFGVVAIIMLFLPNAVLTSNGNAVDINGFQTIFGTSSDALLSITHQFNFLGFVGLLLLALGLIVPLAPLPANFKYLIGALLLLIAGVLFFVYPGTIKGVGTVLGVATDPVKMDYKVGTPLILSGVFTLVGFAINSVLGFFNFKK